VQLPETPTRQLDEVGTQLVLIGSGVCTIVFGIGLLRGVSAMLKTAISLAVAAVPEGLPTIATTTLALGQDMRRHNVLVRSLSAVEALGSRSDDLLGQNWDDHREPDARYIQA